MQQLLMELEAVTWTFVCNCRREMVTSRIVFIGPVAVAASLSTVAIRAACG